MKFLYKISLIGRSRPVPVIQASSLNGNYTAKTFISLCVRSTDNLKTALGTPGCNDLGAEHPAHGKVWLYVDAAQTARSPPEQRRLAYRLIELMAENGNQGDTWEAALKTINAAIKNG